MAKNNIGGIFSASLKKVAHWFLYVFVAADAQLPAAIMTKRKKQIDWLRKIDRWNTYYNFDQLVQIVSEGITERYGMSPAEVLQLMYNTVTGATPGVGTTPGVTVTPGPDITKITAEGVKNLNNLAVENKATKTNVNIWKDIASVIEWLVELIKSLGWDTNPQTWTTQTPTAADWDGEYRNNADITGALPYVVGGVIIYYLFTKFKK